MSDLPYAKKGLGQHWLTDKTALESIVEAANVGSGDFVLEIGPGTGTLTEVLLETGANILALEFDQDAIPPLKKKFASHAQLEIREGDIRKFDLSQLPNNYKVVANIPYYLTANLFRKLIDADNKPQAASLLVQKEVAERLAAKPGKLTFVAVATQLFYKVSLGEIIPAHLFTPPPKVDSQVLILEKLPTPLLEVDIDSFLTLVKSGFEERRKKLVNSLKTGVGRGVVVGEMITEAGLGPNVRAQELSIEDWGRLYAIISSSR